MAMISRRAFVRLGIAGLLGSGGAPLHAEAPLSSLRPMPRGGIVASVGTSSELVSSANLSGAVSFIVIDAGSGAVLDQKDASAPMPPASVAKTVTALFALERLGPQFRYRTRILATGPVENGIVQGDLVLAGDGDPTLQTDQLGDLVRSLSLAGVKGVSGRFLYWSGAIANVPRIADDQPVQVGYNPALGGLNLNFNRVYFEWKRQGADWAVTMDARGERFVPAVKMARMKIAARTSPLYTHDFSETAENWTVAAEGLGKGGGRWLPVRLPEVYTAEVFRTLARAQGITLPEGERVANLPVGKDVAVVESAPLAEILRDMLKFSTNITAEAVGLRASGAGTLAASGMAMTEWVRQKFGVANLHVDHSGLGSESRVTADDLVRMLRGAANSGLREILRDVGMKDAKGKVVKGHPVKVLAKSGTLNFVSCLAGHILQPGGKELIFAILTCDLPRRSALTEEQREQPPGGEAWTRRSRLLQAQLVSYWSEKLA